MSPPRWLVLSRVLGCTGSPVSRRLGTGIRGAPALSGLLCGQPDRMRVGFFPGGQAGAGGCPLVSLPGSHPLPRTQVPSRLARPSTLRRARFAAAASRAKSAATLIWPRTRARRPPWRRRIR